MSHLRSQVLYIVLVYRKVIIWFFLIIFFYFVVFCWGKEILNSSIGYLHCYLVLRVVKYSIDSSNSFWLYNTCVLIWNSSSPEAKPRWKFGVVRSLLSPIFRTTQLAVESFWSLRYLWSSLDSISTQKLIDSSALLEATCIRYIGHRLMISYRGGMGKVRRDKWRQEVKNQLEVENFP